MPVRKRYYLSRTFTTLPEARQHAARMKLAGGTPRIRKRGKHYDVDYLSNGLGVGN